jgi:hypothetical protein
MNVDIRHKQYDSYISQKHMNDNQQALHRAFRASRPGYVESTPFPSSSGTHSYGKWSKGLTDWQAFEEVTSHPFGTEHVAQGKKPMAPEDNEDDDEDYNLGFEDDAEDDAEDEDDE